MESVFYKFTHKKRFPVTYLFLELLAKSADNSGSEADLRTVLEPVLVALGYKPPYKDEMLQQIAADLQSIEESKKSQTGGSKPPAPGKKRSFGQEFVKWHTSLELENSLYLLSDFDFERASQLYCSTPVVVVEKMLATKFERDWTFEEAGFEAVVLGMGGEIRGKTAANEVAAPKDEAEEKQRNQQLKKLGF